MTAPVCADANSVTSARKHAARKALRTDLWEQKNIGPFPSICAILDTSSGAQSLDGGPSDGEPALSPNLTKLGRNVSFRKSRDERHVRERLTAHAAAVYLTAWGPSDLPTRRHAQIARPFL